jgi:hypothetical protein
LDCTEYGNTSSRRGEEIPAIPCTSPSCDAMPNCERRHSGQLERSLERATSRCTATPKVCESRLGYRS